MAFAARFATIVSGVPRSGTSLVMQMLAAGGVPLLVDRERPPDADNPRGYFEYAPVKRLATDDTWFAAAPGRAVKVVHALLPLLPEGAEVRVVLVERDLGEVLVSQRRMLERAGASSPTPGEDERLVTAFCRQLRAARAWATERPRTALLPLGHADLVARPAAAARRIDSFLGGRLDVAAMASCVDDSLYRSRTRP